MSANFRGRGSSNNDCWRRKLESLGYQVALFAMFSRFDTIPACEIQTHTNRQTHDDGNIRALLAPRG